MASSQHLHCVAFLCFLLAFTLCVAQKDVEYYYDYSDGPYGPANWGTLHPEWILCAIGRAQSPIAIDERKLTLNTTNVLATFYKEANVELTNDHALELIVIAGGGFVFWNSEGPYEVLNIHWHTPSEHTLNGVRFPLEGHIVHRGPEDKILVIGILYEFGRQDDFLADILNWKSSNGTITLDDVKGNYYNYMGSLTTPPCNEGVTWIVLQETYTVSKEQVNNISIFNQGNNSRPLQPLNGRKIYKNLQHAFIALSES